MITCHTHHTEKSILQEFNNALDEANEFLQGKSVDSQGHPTANLDDEATSTPATRLPGANPVGRTWMDAVLGGSSICTPNTPSKSVHQISWMHNLSTPFLKQTEDCIHPGVLCCYESDGKRPQGQKTEEVELEEEEGEEEGRMRSRAKRLKRTRQNKEEKGSSHNGQGRGMTNRTQVENERRIVTPLDYRADSGTSAISNALQWSFRPEKPITGYPPRKIKVEGSESTHNMTETTPRSPEFEAKVPMETEHIKKRKTSNDLAGLGEDQERLPQTKKERSRSTTPGKSLPSGSRQKSPISQVGPHDSENRAQELGRHPRSQSGSSLSERHTPALSSTDLDQPVFSQKAMVTNKSARKEETARTGGGRDEIPERTAQGELTAATTVSDLNSDVRNHSLATSYSEDELPPVNLQVNESIDGELPRNWKNG